jgi:hypothetical protein
LVDLEARWENLRNGRATSAGKQSAVQDLPSKQKAYEAFRLQLLTYNRRYAPTHVPELLLNTPARLGKWCLAMCDLYRRLEGAPQVRCPVHLLEKAFRCADHIAGRLNKGPVSRSPQPAHVQDAIRDLEALSQWCAALAGGNAPRGAGETSLAERPLAS